MKRGRRKDTHPALGPRVVQAAVARELQERIALAAAAEGRSVRVEAAILLHEAIEARKAAAAAGAA